MCWCVWVNMPECMPVNNYVSLCGTWYTMHRCWMMLRAEGCCANSSPLWLTRSRWWTLESPTPTIELLRAYNMFCHNERARRSTRNGKKINARRISFAQRVLAPAFHLANGIDEFRMFSSFFVTWQVLYERILIFSLHLVGVYSTFFHIFFIRLN